MFCMTLTPWSNNVFFLVNASSPKSNWTKQLQTLQGCREYWATFRVILKGQMFFLVNTGHSNFKLQVHRSHDVVGTWQHFEWSNNDLL